MAQRNQSLNPSPGSLIIVTLVLIVTFALIGFVALSVVTGNNFGLGSSSSLDHPTPRLASSVFETQAIGTPDPSLTVRFKSAALGFSLEYPQSWRKNEQGLQVILSPSAVKFDLNNLRDSALWFGIPPDNTVDPADLSIRIQASLSPDAKTLNREALTIGGQVWRSVTIRFENEQFGGSAIATIATTNKNEVGYFVVAVAPAEEWQTIQPTFQTILDSFRFTSEAVLRPTDATPPPTPTPSPTPAFHIVQSGDTLSHIAVKYGVTVDGLMTRNNIDDPRSLRVGMKIIIPANRRKR
jgi:LysM repeat protein